MADERSRAEQEAQAKSDAEAGLQPDPQAGQYYMAVYNQTAGQMAAKKQAEQAAPE